MGHEMGALMMPKAYLETSPILPHPKLLLLSCLLRWKQWL